MTDSPQPPSIPPMPPMESGTPPISRVRPNFGRQAAKASWIAPIVAVGLNVVSANGDQSREAKLTIGIASMAIYAIGLILGFVALTRIPRLGREGILVPAICGIVINGIILSLFVVVLMLMLSNMN